MASASAQLSSGKVDGSVNSFQIKQSYFDAVSQALKHNPKSLEVQVGVVSENYYSVTLKTTRKTRRLADWLLVKPPVIESSIVSISKCQNSALQHLPRVKIVSAHKNVSELNRYGETTIKDGAVEMVNVYGITIAAAHLDLMRQMIKEFNQVSGFLTHAKINNTNYFRRLLDERKEQVYAAMTIENDKGYSASEILSAKRDKQLVIDFLQSALTKYRRNFNPGLKQSVFHFARALLVNSNLSVIENVLRTKDVVEFLNEHENTYQIVALVMRGENGVNALFIMNEAGIELTKTASTSMMSALMLATQWRVNIEAIKFVANKIPDDVFPKQGVWLLHLACAVRYTDCIKYLTQHRKVSFSSSINDVLPFAATLNETKLQLKIPVPSLKDYIELLWQDGEYEIASKAYEQGAIFLDSKDKVRLRGRFDEYNLHKLRKKESPL